MHGFGVGAHQFSNLIPLLSDTHQVWALDLLGQGLSWPSREALEGDYHKLHSISYKSIAGDPFLPYIPCPCGHRLCEILHLVQRRS